MIHHIQKDQQNFDDQNPPKIIDTHNFSLVGEVSDPGRKGPWLIMFWYTRDTGMFDKHFNRQNEMILQGKNGFFQNDDG